MKKKFEAIKNCPLCAEKSGFSEDAEGFPVIACYGCGLQLHINGSEEEAITTWNTRITQGER